MGLRSIDTDGKNLKYYLILKLPPLKSISQTPTCSYKNMPVTNVELFQIAIYKRPDCIITDLMDLEFAYRYVHLEGSYLNILAVPYI